MQLKKLLKVGAIVTTVLLAIGLLFVVAFIFNPFEGRVRDLRDAVPRTVDVYLRKERLAGDFVSLPEPKFWRGFAQTVAWEKIRRGPTYQALQRDLQIERVVDQVREQVEAVARDSPLDVGRDLLGTEVQLAVNLRDPSSASAWCFYARVTWRVKMAFGLAGYGFVQEMARGQGIEIGADGDLLRLQPAGAPQPLWAARQLDCVIVGNDRDLVERSLRLARGESTEDTLGGSSDYRDGVDARIRSHEASTGVAANALEFNLRLEQALALSRWDDNWPDPNDKDSMNQRVLAAFVNLSGWRFASGATIFEDDSLVLLARVMLNQNQHTPFQADFFRTEAQPRSEWLDPFLSLVPEDSCALAALRMPAGPFLRQMVRAMEKDWRDLFDEALRRTGVYKSVDDLIAQMELALLPRTGFVFRRNVRRADDPPANDLTPLPQIAWVFWLRQPGGAEIVAKFREALLLHHRAIFNAPAYQFPIEGRPDKVLECTSPYIPATGSLAFLVYDEFFIVSNSAPLISTMISARDGRSRSIVLRKELRDATGELPSAVNGFLYAQGPELEQVLIDLDEFVQSSSKSIDPGWAIDHRSEAEAAVFNERYRSHGSQAAMTPEVRAQFERDVGKRLEEMWLRQSSTFTAEDRAAINETIGICRLFSAAHLQVVLDPQSISLQGRMKFDFR